MIDVRGLPLNSITKTKHIKMSSILRPMLDVDMLPSSGLVLRDGCICVVIDITKLIYLALEGLGRG